MPWDRGELYKLTTTNRAATPAPPVPTIRDYLATFDAQVPPEIPVVLGAAQALYDTLATTATNLPPDERAQAEEQNFLTMIGDVDRMSREGRAEEAINMLRQQLNKPLPPHHRAKINNRIASYYFRMQRYAEALPYMREAVRLDPQDYPTLCNLAAVLMSMGELKEAGFFLRTLDTRRITEYKLLFSVLFNRACLYAMNNEPGSALSDLRRAAEADAAATLASLGDPQLDAIRPSLEFFDLKSRLELHINSPIVESL